MSWPRHARQLLRRGVRRLGFDLTRYPAASDVAHRRAILLDRHRVGVVLDVGANTGQFGRQLRRYGYRARIVSLEPLTQAFQQLVHTAAADPYWDVYRVGASNRCGAADIFVAGNSVSSSLSKMLVRHESAAPQSKVVGSEAIQLVTLDELIDELGLGDERIFAKIDTQGHEHEVLAGAGELLKRLAGLQVEMSLVPLYENQVLWEGIHQLLARSGYTLAGVEPGFWDSQTGESLQFDAFYLPTDGR